MRRRTLYYVTSCFHWLVGLSEVGGVGEIKNPRYSSNAK